MRIGILGAGQLARMMALAGYPLGMDFTFLDPASDACAAPLGRHVQGAFDDDASLEQLADGVDLATYEFENIPPASLELIARRRSLFPSARTLDICQDRLSQKQLFERAAVPTSEYEPVDSLGALEKAIARLGLPLVLKARRGGYDGRGQAVLRNMEDAETAWEHIGGKPAIVERFVPFDREVSIVGARSVSGETAFYPLSENVHREGILRLTWSRHGDPATDEARELLRRLMHELDHVGVATLEMFETGGRLSANELASRVHNSGHWTIEGAVTSQFENHLRAIANLPLGRTDPVGAAAMINCIGSLPPRDTVLDQAGAHLHVYGKASKPGRKVGHVTVCGTDASDLLERMKGLGPAFPGLPELADILGK